MSCVITRNLDSLNPLAKVEYTLQNSKSLYLLESNLLDYVICNFFILNTSCLLNTLNFSIDYP